MLHINDYTKGLGIENGYYSSSIKSNISYPEEGNSLLMILEENSFWFQHRNDIIAEIIKKWYPDKGIVFDIGGGNGYVAKRLQEEGFTPIVVEPGLDGVKNSLKRRIIHVIHSSYEHAGFMDNAIPSTGLFDVLEHIEDDTKFLKSIYSKTTRGGYIYITVPAYKFLWSYEDDFAGHFRRYTVKTLKLVLAKAGFENMFQSYFFSVLPLPVFFFRALPSMLGLNKDFDIEKSKKEHKRSKLASLLVKVSQFELNLLGRTKNIPFGTSIVTVARKA